jgi:hypothetical protein
MAMLPPVAIAKSEFTEASWVSSDMIQESEPRRLRQILWRWPWLNCATPERTPRPGVKVAHQVARQLQMPGREIEIDASAQQGKWLVVICQSLVVTPESMEALRLEFEGAAHPVGGHYDRWQVDIAGA